MNDGVYTLIGVQDLPAGEHPAPATATRRAFDTLLAVPVTACMMLGMVMKSLFSRKSA